MAPNKKRKLDNAQTPQMMSAVALRRKLLRERAQEQPGPPDENGDKPDVQSPQHGEGTRQRTPKPGEIVAPSSEGTSMSSQTAEAVTVSDTRPRSTRPVPDTVILEPAAGVAMPRVTYYSSFKPTGQNLLRRPDGTLVLNLQDGERLVILGSYGIRVLTGQVTIAGAALRPSTGVDWVHAPHCHALPVLRCSDESTVELLPYPGAEHLRALESLSPVFGRLWNEEGGKRSTTFQLIYTSADGPKRAMLHELVSRGEWNKEIADLVRTTQKRPRTVLVCGPKSSGKSTFSRLLANRLMTDEACLRAGASPGIALLDLDPGQPEFSPPGVVSLIHVMEPNLAPPFCHPLHNTKNILRSHAIASVTPAMNPEHYLECSLDLYALYVEKLHDKCPLIINTPGWIQGTGLDLLVDLIAGLSPSEVIYMSKEGPAETVEALTAATTNHAFTTLPSESSEYTSRTALHLRTMQTMSYFHLDLQPKAGWPLQWSSTPLTASAPLTVKYAGQERGIFGIICYDYQPPTSLLAEALNGSLVAVVEIAKAEAFRNLSKGPPNGDADIDAEQNMGVDAEKEHTYPVSEFASIEKDLIIQTPEALPFIKNPNGGTLDPAHSELISLALIRGVDSVHRKLQLLMPIFPDRMKRSGDGGKTLVLVAGNFDTPSWAYTEDLYHRSSASGLARDDEGQAGEDVEVTDEETDEDRSDRDENAGESTERSETPWVEVLRGSQKRAVGSRVWRVRRDLGRGGYE